MKRKNKPYKQPCEICASCDARLRPDPYDQDVNNKTVLRWLCDHCAHELAMDI